MTKFCITSADIPNWKSINTGPAIFAQRLNQALIRLGHQIDTEQPEKNFIIIHGGIYPNCTNVLRLDGLYLGKDMYIKNRFIYESYNAAQHIIFQSNFSKDMYFHYAGPVNNYSIIHNGIDTQDLQKLDFISKTPTVVINSRNRPHKRLKETIEVFADQKLKDIDLIVMGMTNIDFPNASPNVKFSGPVSNIDVLNILQTRCDALLHPAWLDWCPNSVVEAQALGIPVLCTFNGGTKELVRHGVIAHTEPIFHPSHPVDLENPPVMDKTAYINAILKVVTLPRMKLTPQWLAPYSIYSTAQQYIDV